MNPSAFLCRLILLCSVLLFAACSDNAATTGPNDAAVNADLVNPGDTPAPVDGTVTDTPSTPDSTEDSAQPQDTAVADTAICEGCFGWPCADNDDCNSGWCLDGPDGKVCSETCDGDCPEGWSCKAVSTGGSDVSFICVYVQLEYCRPCNEAADCVNPLLTNEKGYCQPQGEGEGSFCAPVCFEDGDCPASASCVATQVDGEDVSLCKPKDGQCTCSSAAISEEASTNCLVTNELGSCQGTRYCAPEGLTECDATPAVQEICNGVDDNCSELVDGADPTLELQPCESQDGVCEGAIKASTLCVGGEWQACDPVVYEAHNPAFEPMMELTCDGLDNDCDGSADEDFTLTTLDGTELSGVGVPCGTGACAGGETVCNAENNGIICSTEAAKTEVCDGIDNDCDGLVDGADFDLVLEPCAKNVGVCEGLIMTTDYCVDGTWKACTDEDYLAYNDTYEPEAETVCDGLDNDCDGAVDDDFLLTQLDGSTVQGVGQPCGLGACVGGVTLCGGDEASIICSTAGESSPEICDGIDNDCDGLIDTADPDLVLAPCENQKGLCDGSVKPAPLCVNGQWQPCEDAQYTAHAAAYNPNSETSCDGVDEDCDGAVDDDFTHTQIDGAQVKGAGKSCGVGACQGGITACNDAKDGLVCPTEENVSGEVCDGVDNDCDGQLDAADDQLQIIPCGNQKGVCDGAMQVANNCKSGSWVSCGNDVYSSHSKAYKAGSEKGCDAKDNNCNGLVDEGLSFDVDGDGHYKIGSCLQPADDCDDNNKNIYPGNVEQCDNIDNNCDGSTDPNGSAGCNTYYKDADSDTWGVAQSVCSCAKNSPFTATKSGDCYDSNNKAKPGQVSYYGSNRGDGSFDYNCDNAQEKKWTKKSGNCAFFNDLCSGEEGYESVPACGKNGTWVSGCYYSTDGWPWEWGCYWGSKQTRKQECR